MKSFKNFLMEMSRDIGGSYSPLTGSENTLSTSKHEYNNSREYSHHSFPFEDKSIEIVHNKINNRDIYHTNDHTSEKTLHKSVIVTHEPTNEIGVKHQEQIIADRVRGGKLPKNYATDFIYNYFKTSNLPLRSSDTQFKAGHDMWRRLAHRALNDNYHVYFHDGETLHKTSTENLDNHLNSSFGKTIVRFGKLSSPDYEKRHIILSKEEL